MTSARNLPHQRGEAANAALDVAPHRFESLKPM
jgi:hypothetical protein